jgi:copper(I)-binding protein
MRRLMLLLLLPVMLGATAQTTTALQVQDAWVPEAPPGATVLAAYLVIENPGTQAEALESVTSPDFAAVEMHISQVVNGIASMTEQKELPIPARGRQVLAAGGTHLMLMRPKRALRAGDVVHLRLHFSGATTLDIRATVRRAAPDILHSH